jgi:excisionase family DNA binding protein
MVYKDKIPYSNNGKELVFDLQEIDKWNENRLSVIEKDKKFLTMQEAMIFLDLKKRTLYQYAHENKIPYHKQGKFLRFKKKELELWMKSR